MKSFRKNKIWKNICLSLEFGTTIWFVDNQICSLHQILMISHWSFVFKCEIFLEMVGMFMANPWISMKGRKLGGAAFTFATKSPYVIIHNVTRRVVAGFGRRVLHAKKKEIVSTFMKKGVSIYRVSNRSHYNVGYKYKPH